MRTKACLGLHRFGLEDEGLWGCLGLHCFGFGIVRTKGFFGDMFRLVVITPPPTPPPVVELVESANFTGTVNTPLAKKG